MPHFPPPPEIPARVGLFRRVPPAIFPPMLGLLGLVAAWRQAVRVFSPPEAPVEMFAGGVSLLFLFCIVAYMVKLMFRPGVLAEDLSVLPGRLGLAAFSMAFMVFANVLAPLAPNIAAASLGLGLTMLTVLALYVLAQLLRDRVAFGPLTPALHLVFVGFVVAPVAAVPMGVMTSLAPVLVWYSLAMAVIVTVATIGPLAGQALAPPLRPLQAIHLAPPAFLSTDFFLTGHATSGWMVLGWATLVFVLLVMRARWLTAGSFSPFWSAFTFPMTAYAAALLLAAQVSGMAGLRIAGGLVLIAATLIVPTIAYRVMKLWATGMLAAKSNAAIA